MEIITYTRAAKCKDCKFLESFYDGKRLLHRCENKESPEFSKRRTLKDLVCDNWQF